jgi:transposase
LYHTFHVEDRIRADHPLRAIKRLVDEDLSRMSAAFNKAYSGTGRPSVPPERLLKALLLQALYSIRSETQLVERIDTDLLFRWFLDMDPSEPAFDETAFTHNRPRLDRFGLTQTFFARTVRRALREQLVSTDHFSVDGTLIEAHASIKSFVPKSEASDDSTGTPDAPDRLNEKKEVARPADGNPFKSRNAEVDFHGQKRSNATHASRTDPEARLYRKGDGQAAKLYHLGHAVADNRHGLILAVDVTSARGDAEREAAVDMIDDLRKRHRVIPATCGADKGYDAGPFMIELERRGITPHVAMREGRVGGKYIRTRRDQDAIAARQRMQRRARTLGYRLSQKTRKRVEEAFGWLKQIAGLARTRLIGHWKIRQQLQIAAAAYNLVRIRSLQVA